METNDPRPTTPHGYDKGGTATNAEQERQASLRRQLLLAKIMEEDGALLKKLGR